MSGNNVKITEHKNGDMTITCFDGVPPWHELDSIEVAVVEAHYRAKFAAERMPEDVQALVERVEALARAHRVQARGGFRPDHAEQADLFEQIHTALEAAYSQKAEAWDEGANAELARARSQGADNPDIPHPVNPYRNGAVDEPR